MKSNYTTKWILWSLAAASASVPAPAQTFSSGSTGSDGALTYNTPGNYVFDPKSFTPPLDPNGTGVFNFTTITIAAGVTVRLGGDVYASPIVWLAQSAVTINGTLDLSGQNGFSATNTTQRTNTIPGSGGYGGGYPGVGNNPPGAGLGPAGGLTTSPGCNSAVAGKGLFTGNQFLVPLIGGSGGGGNGVNSGGAGGGAILIASSVSISGTGSIKANGGAGLANFTYSEVGAGGAIRLVAPTVTLSGNLNASAGISPNDGCQSQAASVGVVRIEAFQIGAINASGNLYTATPFGLFLSSSGIPAVSVVSVGGNPVATSPTGTFTVPDVTVNSNGPLSVAIQGANVPIGTVVTLVIFSENGPDQTIQSTPLAGTLASSTATASVTLPSGFSKGFVKATFTQ
jgi:hypothetical protein